MMDEGVLARAPGSTFEKLDLLTQALFTEASAFHDDRTMQCMSSHTSDIPHEGMT
jgi:hypothetical protein